MDPMSDQRNMEYYIQEDQSLVPIRWMPPEAVFDKKYSVKSDVWSFGVTLWEIFTLSLLPYSEIAHSDVATRTGLKFLNIKNIYILRFKVSECFYNLSKGEERLSPKRANLSSQSDS